MPSPGGVAQAEGWGDPQVNLDRLHLENLAKIAHACEGCDCLRCITKRQARAYLGLDPNG